MSLAVLLADGDGTLFSGWMRPGSAAGQITIMIGAILLVGIIMFLWVAVYRTPRPGSHHHSIEGGGLPARHKRRSKLARMMGKKRRKRRRSRERPVNPTLAQVGGLPPRRDEHPPS